MRVVSVTAWDVAVFDGALDDFGLGDGGGGHVGPEIAVALCGHAIGIGWGDDADAADFARLGADGAIGGHGDVGIGRGDAERGAGRAEEGVAVHIANGAVWQLREVSGAGQARAAGRADGEVAVTADGEVERVAGVLERPGWRSR